ncbi:MAG: NAD-dependent epimerase/dehydratase family protein [Caldilineaceae bacterium]|nr:NAD-dependent epimerase/dehydratase family protein [Caldilineaceae bacterium]
MHIFVTGATGAVGPTVVAALVAAGHTVRALVRTPPPVGLLPPVVELVYGDITAATSLPAAMAGCDGVVHMAALLHIVDPPPALRATYTQVNITGTANLIAAAQAQGVARLVFLSTIAVYGNSQGRGCTETTPPQPDTFYGETKLAAERLVLAALRQDGIPLGTVLRLAAVYGARVKGNYQRLLTALARGRFVPVGRGTNRRTLVHEADVAAAVLLALHHPAAAGQLYNVTDGALHPLHTVVAAICAALHRPPPRFYLPVPPVRLAVGLVEDALALVGRRAPVGRSLLAKYGEEVMVDGSRLAQELGFVPRYDLVQGWQEVIARQSHGEIPT